MCGIVGYAGLRPGKPIILDGLRHLEYRGYDSAGIALLCDGDIDVVRAVGNLDALIAAAGNGDSPAVVGLGHTRWATHGRPSQANAHPHDDCTGRISIVLNGIIENYKQLRAELTGRGHTLTSETDAEVVAHLIEESIAEGLAAAVRATVRRLDGNYAFCAISADEPRADRGHAPRGAARGRPGRRRSLHRLGHPRLSGPHTPRAGARRRRRRLAVGRRRRRDRRRRRAGRTRRGRGRPGTPTPPKRAATRPS